MEESKDKIINVPIDDIIPNRFQPRLAFDEKELNELANSILKYGVIQPIVLRKTNDKYEIIAGERRYKASVLAGLKTIPAIINNTDDNTSAEIALLENLQRKNLTVIEEAKSYKKLMDKGFTQEDIAGKLGISQSSIANRMRLLNLPKKVQDALLYNKISERHARSLLSLNDEDLQINLLNKIIDEKLTVKQTEDEVSLIINKSKKEEIKVEIKEEQKNEIKESIFEDRKAFIEDLPNEKTIIHSENKVPDIISIDDEKNTNNNYAEQDIDEFEKILNQIRDAVSEKSDSTKIINPFQEINDIETMDLEENTPEEEIEYVEEIVEEKPKKSVFENVDNDILDEIENVREDEDKLLNEYGDVNLPRVISKIRNFISSLDEIGPSIKTSELDLADKYQIIIDIDKDTNK